MALVFLPGTRNASDKAFLFLVYLNVFPSLTLYLVSWVSLIRNLATVDAIEQKIVKGNPSMQGDAMILPLIFIIMPCHREPHEILINSVSAILNSDYPSQRLQFFLSFDGLENKDSFYKIAKELGASFIGSAARTATAVVKDVRITISLFEHGGKVSCQSKALALVKDCLAGSHTDTSKAFLLLVDSDTRVDKNSLKVLARPLVSKSHQRPNWYQKLFDADSISRQITSRLFYQLMQRPVFWAFQTQLIPFFRLSKRSTFLSKAFS